MNIKNKANLIKGILFIFLVFIFIIFINSILISINFKNISIDSLFYSLGKLAGLIGFSFLSLLIISGDTARFFDKFFGIDKIIIFQRKFSLITVLFVILHPVFFIISSKSILTYLIPDFSVIPSTLGIISLYIFIIIMIASSLYKRISYKIWQYLHILIYILFFFSLYHAVNLGSDSNYLPIKLIYLSFLIAMFIGIIYRTGYKLKQSSNKFMVKEIKWENEKIFTLILKTNKKFNFKSGQFCFLRLNKDKLYARHPFTISSSPADEDLHFTIKLNGRFTKSASELKEGEEIIVEGPFGIFVPEEKNIVLIAGGIGITPFISMIRNNIISENKKNILLFYCSKTKEDLIFKKELDSIKEKWLEKVYILSGEESEVCEKGRINKEIIKKYIKSEDYTFYICGPEEMKNCLIRELKEIGIKKDKIKTESFFW